MEAAKESVESGRGHLEVAEDHQKAARRKQCYILICILIILGIIIIPVAVTQG